MNFWFLVPILLGTVTIIQSGINKDLGSKVPLSLAVLLNGLILSAIAFCTWAALEFSQGKNLVGSVISLKENFRWYYILPGIFGFAVVFGIPISMAKISGAKTFILLILAQVTTSMLWDHFSEADPVTLKKIAGVIIAVFGVLLI